MWGWLRVILLAWSMLAVPPAVASPPGVKLVVNPPNLVFRLVSSLRAGSPALADLQVQVMAQPQQTWRLTVIALGPIVSEENKIMPTQQISWRGSPGSVFMDGVLTTNTPQLCGRGVGPKSGVLHFVLKPSREAGAGHYNQKLLFSLSSP